MKQSLIILALLTYSVVNVTCSRANGQIVTEKNLRDGSYGEKKLSEAPKKIYLNQFAINHQVLASSTEASAGGKTKAKMAFSQKGKIEIPGVMEKRKFKAYVTRGRSSATSYSGIVYTNKKELEVSHQVKADREAFQSKTQQVLNEYLSHVVDQFIVNLNG